MWGATSSCDELTGDFGGAFEATSIDDCRSFCRLAEDLSHGILGLLQHYPPEADFATVRVAPRARHLGSTAAARLLACCSYKMLFELVAHVLDQMVVRSMPLVSEAKPGKGECDAAEKCHRKECRSSVPGIESS